jgi:type III secretory pathway component EscT
MERLSELFGGEDAITRLLLVGTLVAARVAPLTVLAPFFALKSAPVLVRTAITLALTVSFVPVALEVTPELPTGAVGGVGLSLLVVREALVGAVFGACAGLPLYALDWAGRLTDTFRGASLAEVIAPMTGERTSPLGDLYLLAGIVLFLSLGGHRVALEAFADGLVAVPPGAVDVGAGIEAVAFGALRLVTSALAFAAAVAAPAAAAIVLVEVSLGLVARAAPQIPVFFAGMPLRAAVGLAAALFAFAVVIDELPPAFRDAIDSAAALVLPLAR